MAGDGVRITVT